MIVTLSLSSAKAVSCVRQFSDDWNACDDKPNTPLMGVILIGGGSYTGPSEREICQGKALTAYDRCKEK